MQIQFLDYINCINDADAGDIYELAKSAKQPEAQVRLIRTCRAESGFAPVVFRTKGGDPTDEQVAQALYWKWMCEDRLGEWVDPDDIDIAVMTEDGYENLY